MSNLAVIGNKMEELVKFASIVQEKTADDVRELITIELGHLKRHYEDNAQLRECTDDSLLLSVKEVIKKNLSLDKNAGLVYLMTRNVNKGTKEAPKWVKICEVKESPNGLISLNRQMGLLLDIERPKLIRNDKGKVIGGSVNILKNSYPEPRWETMEFDEFDIKRWAKYSEKQNKGRTNELYTSGECGGIDDGFMRAKIIKHSLANLGKNIMEKRGNAPKLELKEVLTQEENQTVSTEDAEFEEM